MVLFVLFISTIFVFVLFNKFVFFFSFVQSVVYLLIGKSEAGRKCIYFYFCACFLNFEKWLLAYNFL